MSRSQVGNKEIKGEIERANSGCKVPLKKGEQLKKSREAKNVKLVVEVHLLQGRVV